MNNKIPSTLNLNGSSKLVKIISSDFLIKSYLKEFNIDIRRHFNGVNQIGVYECSKTGYRFYYPFNIDGDGDFYKLLEHFDWYYMPWKWEHGKTLSLITKNDKILEVGSGGLGFLEKLNNLGYIITGLELNPSSIEKGKKNNLNVINETIQNHVSSHANTYDIVCSYQVLEHISEVHTFIQAKIDCLKQGGKLIISVPNNDSFIKHTDGGILNMPPHHMGLWKNSSLKMLTSIFDIELSKIYYEPLQDYHLDWYVKTVLNDKVRKYKLLWRLYKKFKMDKLARFFIKQFKNNIKGHSIMAIYIKK